MPDSTFDRNRLRLSYPTLRRKPRKETFGGGDGGGSSGSSSEPITDKTRAQLEADKATLATAGQIAIPTDGVTNPNGIITERWICTTAGEWEQIDTIGKDPFLSHQYDGAVGDGQDWQDAWQAAHAKHVMIEGGGSVAAGGDTGALWYLSQGGKWQRIGIAGSATLWTYYWRANGGNIDNEPQWQLATDPTGLATGQWTIFSVYHFATTVWVTQDGVLLATNGTFGSGRNDSGLTDEGDHYANATLPGNSTSNAPRTMARPDYADIVALATADVPAENAAAIEAHAQHVMNSWVFKSRQLS